MDSSSPLVPWIERWRQQGVNPYPSVFALHRVEQVSSTNSLLWQRLALAATRQDAPMPVIIAGSQSCGRGQWGRQWHSSPGGLYLSSCLPALAVPAGALMVGCAWGICAALRQFNVPVRIKWPNDLVVDTHKLGGMLVETRIRGTQTNQAILGIGINWRNAPPASGIAIAALNNVYPPLSASLDTLTAAVLSGIAVGCSRLRSQPIESITADYEAVMTHRGQAISFCHQGRQWLGYIAGIASTGQLRICLTTPDNSVGERPGDDGPSSDGPDTRGLGNDRPNSDKPDINKSGTMVIADPGSVHLPYDTAAELPRRRQ
ncbi:MAG: biotin--[acetyl-CoA-carboxylase] ligase [Cyanobacteria bacterium P01_A01_bin.135]